jgi:NADPH:quinone reductase-like Zn-dependent oxidoreductase
MSNTVKIVRFHKTGPAEVLQFDEVATPEPGPGEIRLRVKALGLNRAEIMFRNGQYLETPVPPAKNGYEAAGIIEAVGPGVDSSTATACMSNQSRHFSSACIGCITEE